MNDTWYYDEDGDVVMAGAGVKKDEDDGDDK